MSGHSGRRSMIVSRCCAAVGILGSLACSVSMTLVVLGVTGVAVSTGSMGGMQGTQGMGGASSTQLATGSGLGEFIQFLVHAGPNILLVSVAAVVVGFGIRRRIAAIPALGAGALMYWGMYLQSGAPLMYVSILLGLFSWAAVYWWTLRGERPPGRRLT